MNELQIIVGENKNPKLGRASIDLKVAIDQEVVGDGLTVDFQELYRTLRYSSEMWLWTSANGEPLDVGINEFVAVDRRDHVVLWEWYSPITVKPDSKESARQIICKEFDRSAYDQAIHRAWWEICSLLRQRTDIQTFPLTLTARSIFGLREWIGTVDAQPWQGEFLTTSWKAVERTA